MYVFQNHRYFNYNVTERNATAAYQYQILLVLNFTRAVETFLIIFTISCLIFMIIVFVIWLLNVIFRLYKRDGSREGRAILREFEVNVAGGFFILIYFSKEDNADDEHEFDFPPSYSMLDLQLVDDDLPPPEYGAVVRSGEERNKIRMFWRNSSLEDAGDWRKRRVLDTKLCKSLDLYWYW